MQTELKNVRLVMVEAYKMPERKYNEEKKDWVSTGGETTMYSLTFLDEFRVKLILNSTKKEYADLEGKNVNLQLELANGFQNKGYKISLKGLQVAE